MRDVVVSGSESGSRVHRDGGRRPCARCIRRATRTCAGSTGPSSSPPAEATTWISGTCARSATRVVVPVARRVVVGIDPSRRADRTIGRERHAGAGSRDDASRRDSRRDRDSRRRAPPPHHHSRRVRRRRESRRHHGHARCRPGACCPPSPFDGAGAGVPSRRSRALAAPDGLPFGRSQSSAPCGRRPPCRPTPCTTAQPTGGTPPRFRCSCTSRTWILFWRAGLGAR